MATPSPQLRKTAPSSRGAAKTYGGNSNAVRSQLTAGARNVVGNGYAFAAVKEDGSVVTWGGARNGGDSGAVQCELCRGRC